MNEERRGDAETRGHGVTASRRHGDGAPPVPASPRPRVAFQPLTPRGDPAPRVLVVDDEPHVLETIVSILGEEGYQVVAAGSAEEALARLRVGPFDLVLTDLRLEGDSGVWLLAELRRLWPETPAIVLTGYASLESAIDSLRQGAYDYLLKPCAVEELKATVARGIERAALARALRERLEELDAANAKLRSLSGSLQQRVNQATVELRQKVEELAEAKRRLEEAHRQREEFVSMIAHELSQPLTMISGYAQLLGRPSLPAEVQERARNTIVSETRRLSRLVQDLADASRLAAGRFRLQPVPCDLAELVREQVELTQASTDRHAVRLEAPPHGVPVVCDRDRLAQVLANLLTNAVKYTPGGEIRVRLWVEAEQAACSVRDQGPRIPPDRLEAIFEPHVRLAGGEDKNGPKGTGLGLYIVKGIVEAHGGRIWAESPGPSQGTAFTFTLPLAPPQA